MYECDLCFTPMIMADSYVKSAKARAHEFQTDTGLFKYCYQNQIKLLFIKIIILFVLQMIDHLLYNLVPIIHLIL